MTAAWSPEELERISRADESQIAGKRADGTLRRWVPIWVVCVGEQVYMRTSASRPGPRIRARRESST
jgi:hypothetical protein